ncbi:MAG: hypothetical protein GY874_15280 [Desulfobacteraceae bacterium]|nr:hypothetical protein [Desulfobacteraceae bacterium]
MSPQSNWRRHLQVYKPVFIMVAVGLLFLELEIFAMAAIRSGSETRLQILNDSQHILYSEKGNHLDQKDKIKFEQTFGPLANYKIEVVTIDRPFPFQAWFAAAVGLPVGAVLLLGFFVRAYEALFMRTVCRSAEKLTPQAESLNRQERVLNRISRYNIFVLGALVLLIAVGLWAGPRLLTGLISYVTALIAQYKWIMLAAIFTLLVLAAWIIYLRYRLAAKAIESRAEVEKYRLQLEILGKKGNFAQLDDISRLQLNAPECTDTLEQQGQKTDSADNNR